MSQVLELLELEAGGEEEEEEKKEGEFTDSGAIKKKAALYLAGGAALAALFADPLVDSIGGFSQASGIPPFFVAFVVTPFASNASELFSSFIFAKGRRKKNISLTFSQLYGGVTMNNTLYV
jgi:Ca2+/Na+ antiporter